MKEWILSVVAAILLTVLLESVLSEGAVKKYAVGFIKLALIFVILSPVFRFLRIDSFSFPTVTETSIVDTAYVKNTERRRYEEAERTLEGYLSSYFDDYVVDSNLLDVGDGFELLSVEIDLRNAVINKEVDHTMIIAEIKRKATRIFGIEEEKILIYGLDPP